MASLLHRRSEQGADGHRRVDGRRRSDDDVEKATPRVGIPRDFDEPRDPFEILEGARAARSEPERSEAAVLAALQVAPTDRAVRIAAYKFYFYNARLAEALPHAAWCIADGAAALGLHEDWRRLASGSVPCGDHDPARRFLVQSLAAYGWCLLRIGRVDEGREALIKVIDIDPLDAFGIERILEVVIRGVAVDEDD